MFFDEARSSPACASQVKMDVIDPETRAHRRSTLTNIVAVIRKNGQDSGPVSDAIGTIITHSEHYGDRCDTLWTEIMEEYENLRYVFHCSTDAAAAVVFPFNKVRIVTTCEIFPFTKVCTVIS